MPRKRAGQPVNPPEKPKRNLLDRVAAVVGIVLCFVLIPIVAVNMTLLIKSLVNPDQIPSIFGYVPIILQSNDMEPSLQHGDLLIIKKVDPQTLTIGAADGDVISFEWSDPQVATLRLVAIEQSTNGQTLYIVRGDAMEEGRTYSIPADRIIGKQTLRLKGAGSFALFAQSPMGMACLIGVPILLLLLYELLRKKPDAKPSPGRHAPPDPF